MDYTTKEYQLNKQPLVSILIPVYNQIEIFGQAVKSALNQTYPHIEVIVSDDASTDGNIENVCNEFDDPRMKYYRNGENLGMHGNFQRMLNELANGELVTKIDADDYLTDDTFIEDGVRMFHEETGVSLIFGKVNHLIVSTGKVIEDHHNDSLNSFNDGTKLFYAYSKGLSFPHTGTLFHRELALDYGCYRHKAMSEDWESFLRMVVGRKVGYIRRPIAIKRLHTQNFTKSIVEEDFKKHASYIDSVFHSLKTHPEINPLQLENWYLEMRKRHHVKWLVKLWYLDRQLYQKYIQFIRAKESEVYQSLRRDLKFQGFSLIKHSPRLMRFVFQHILKQQSFIDDLLENA